MAKTVYLVEDSPVLRTQILQAIEESGRYRLAGSSARAQEAIAEIREQKPQVLVVDLQLEQGSGWDVVDACAGIPQHVIILSNYSAPPFRAAAESRRIPHFFDKTTEFEAFIQTLQEFS